MASKNRPFGPLLVLGFAIFIAGLLTGMLAIAVIGISSDITMIGITIFALGFALGIISTYLAILSSRHGKNPVSYETTPESKTN